MPWGDGLRDGKMRELWMECDESFGVFFFVEDATRTIPFAVKTR